MGYQEYEKIWQEWIKKDNYDDAIEYHYQERQPLINLVKKYLAPTKKFLEFGCGTAVDSYIIKEDIPECEGYAVDLSLTALQVAKKIGKSFSQPLFFGVMDGENLSFRDSSFDVIFSQGVMEHFEDPLPMLSEQIRILKSDGKLIVCVPQKYNPYTLYKHRAMRTQSWEWGWETEYSLSDLKKLGEQAGLKILDYCGHEYVRTDYGLWCLRKFFFLLQKRNPVRDFFLFRFIERTYDKIWQFFEKRWGHNFMVNITVVYKKDKK